MKKKDFKERLESIGHDFNYMTPEVKEAIADCWDVFNQKRVKTDLYSRLMEMYFKWMERVNGFKPNINGQEGKALKQIITYLRSMTDNDEQAFETLHHVFLRWKEIDPFYQKQLKLSQINSNLTNIIGQLKNGKEAGTSINREYLESIRNDLQA